MKQNLLNSLRLQLCALVALFSTAFAGQAWGEEKTITLTSSSTYSPALPTASASVNSTATAHSAEGLAFKEAGIYVNSAGYIMFAQNKGYLYNTATLGTIKSVALTYTNGCSTSAKAGVYFGNTEQSTYTTTSNKTVSAEGKTDTWNNTTNGYGFFQISTSNKNCQISKIVITYEDGGSTTETCATPTFNPAAGEVAAGTEVTISSTTSDATIYYTTDGSTPSTTNGTQGSTVTINNDCTVKAIAVKEGAEDSDVATAEYTIMQAISGYNIDFENDLDSYVDWDFVNIGNSNTAIDAHGGSKYGANINDSGNAVTTASITTKAKIANPTTFTCYVSKTSSNSTVSTWYVEVSTDGSDWTEVATQSAVSMNKGDWTEVTANLGTHKNAYVRLRYNGTNAIRAVDDISIVEGGKMTATVNIGKTALNIGEATTVTTDGPAVTLSTSDAAIASVEGTTVTAVAAGTATITATWAENDEYEGGSQEFAVTVTDPNAPGSQNNPYTVAQALDASPSNGVFVTGTVSNITEFSTQYHNATYEITDGTKTMIVYRGKYLNNADFTESSQLKVGDVVIVTGELKEYKGVNQLAQGNYIVSLTREKQNPTIGVDDASVAYGSTYTINEALINGGDITVTSGNTAIATVNSLVITPVAVGSVEITVATAENDQYNAGSETFTLTVTAPEGKTTAPQGSSAFSLTTIFKDKDLGYDEGMNWDSTIEANAFESSGDARGVQFGAAKGTFSLSSSINQAVTKVSIVMSTNGAGNTFAVTVGGNAFTSTYGDLEEPATTISLESGLKNETLEFNGTGTGNIVININDKVKSVWIKSITISGEGSSAPTITYNIPSSGVGTYCNKYPLDLSATALPSDVKAYAVESQTETSVTLAEITSPVKGGTGFIIKATGETKTVNFTSVDCENELTDNLLVGTLAPTYLREGKAYGMKGGQFHINNAGTIPANRAYLPAETNNPVKALTLTFKDADGITTTRTITDAATIYDLTGRRLQSTQKGVNIVNGKKVLVK